MKTNKALHITGSTARTLLALTFLFSGFVKAVDPLGTVYKIEDYLKAFGGFWTDLMPYAGIAAVCLIIVEWLLGWAMLCNVRTQWTSWLALLFYLVMTPLTLYIALNNPVSDCGCFGDALVLTNWQTFWKNVVLLTLVIILLCCKKAIPQLFSWWAEVVIALFAIGSGLGIMAYSYTHLPPLDFRPYKIGNHIPSLMEVPEGENPNDVYEYKFIYEKDGVQQEFTLENYPKGDSTWTFVEQNTVLVQKGYQPPVHDFIIENLAEGDITDDVLASEQPVTLVAMYDLQKTDRKQLGKLMAIIHNAENVYFLTGSGEEDVYAFADGMGWDTETTERIFCFIDPVTLKTVVRANPGVVVIQNGTVIEKHNMKQL